ncbi:discoidin domain-containing protein [Akkermansia massiliensis]
MGRPVNVAAVIYTPRKDSAKGTVDRYAVYLSADGNDWGAPAAEGSFPISAPIPFRSGLTWRRP